MGTTEMWDFHSKTEAAGDSEELCIHFLYKLCFSQENSWIPRQLGLRALPWTYWTLSIESTTEGMTQETQCRPPASFHVLHFQADLISLGIGVGRWCALLHTRTRDPLGLCVASALAANKACSVCSIIVCVRGSWFWLSDDILSIILWPTTDGVQPAPLNLLPHPREFLSGTYVIRNCYQRMAEVDVRKTESCRAVTEDLFIVHLDHKEPLKRCLIGCVRNRPFCVLWGHWWRPGNMEEFHFYCMACNGERNFYDLCSSHSLALHSPKILQESSTLAEDLSILWNSNQGSGLMLMLYNSY